jgi:ribonuclease HII
MSEFEQNILDKNYQYILGCDEVGRGPLAGPVVACVTVFDKDFYNTDLSWKKEVKDSKKLSASKRKLLTEKILASTVACEIGMNTNLEIDDINIHQATLSAMNHAVQSALSKGGMPISIENSFLFIDGIWKVPSVEIAQQAVIKGDDKIFAVSCASIVAKVYRDELMEKYHDQYPEYGFDQHKGYGTKQHIAQIKRMGLTPIHRVTFCKNFI